MRELGKGNAGVITQTRRQQGLDPIGCAMLQDVDIDTGIEQKLRAARRLPGDEWKRFVGSAIEAYCPPPGFKSPE
jgi:hypothetical protein